MLVKACGNCIFQYCWVATLQFRVWINLLPQPVPHVLSLANVLCSTLAAPPITPCLRRTSAMRFDDHETQTECFPGIVTLQLRWQIICRSSANANTIVSDRHCKCIQAGNHKWCKWHSYVHVQHSIGRRPCSKCGSCYS